MKQILLGAILLMIMSIDTYGEVLDRNKENNTTVLSPDQIKVKTVRNVLGMNNPLEHTTGQLRTGYITHKEDGSKRNSGYALGGHYHLDTKRWNGLKVGLSAYTVLNLGVNQNPLNLNPDFFDADGNSFIQLTEAYLDGKWGNTEIKLGRQLLDTPHADSDDIRMIPNYFEAYTLRNNDIEGLTLSAGLITKMAGWENGVDAQKFVNTGKTLGSGDTNGIFYVSALYEGIKELSLSLWYYNYIDIADVLYAEAGYHIHFSKDTVLTMGLQYDGSHQNGAALLREQDADTYGISMEFAEEAAGLHILAAYNQDNGRTGATPLSLGGGPFFTSMENQTLDAVGSAGSAWMIGAGYHFDVIGINGLVAGIAYGNFQARDSGLYESHETDTVFEYAWSDKLSLTAAFASVRFDAGKDGDNTALKNFKQFRFIVNYNFN